MDSLSDANIITVLIVLYFIYQIIFELQIYYGPHNYWTLLFKYVTRLHLNHILSESCDDINLTDLLMPYFVIFCVNCRVSSDFITRRICKTKKTEHAEMSVSAKLLFKNNKLNKCILDNRNMIYKWCCTVCSQWDAEKMSLEAHRLATFKYMRDCTNYPVTKLAQSGLFYNADSSTVQCCRCHRVLSGSDDMENQRSWHEEGCEFMNVRSPTYEDIFQHDQESTIHQQISEARARYPSETVQNAAGSQQERSVPLAEPQSTEERGFFPSRDSTSSTLGRSLLIRPEDKAAAGFFYAGYMDCVRCFYSGLGQTFWRSGDVPAYQHAKYCPHCGFSILYKDQDYIDHVQQELCSERQGPGNRVQNQTDPAQPQESVQTTTAPVVGGPQEQDYLNSEAAKDAVRNGWTTDQVRQAVSHIVIEYGESCLEIGLLTDILTHFSTNNETRQNQPTNSSSGSSDPGIDSTMSPLTTQYASSAALANALTMGGNEQDRHEDNQRMQDEATPAGASNVEQPEARVPNPGDILRSVEGEHRLLEEWVCRLCRLNPVNCVYLPCGHMIACHDCSVNATHCVVCKKKIKGLVKSLLFNSDLSRSVSSDPGINSTMSPLTTPYTSSAALANVLTMGGNEQDRHKDNHRMQDEATPAGAFNVEQPEARVPSFGDFLRSVEREDRVLEELVTCRLCRLNPVNCVYLPCGHVIACQDCADNVTHCDFCKKTIIWTVKLFNRYLGCPSHQDSKEATKIAIKRNLPYKEARGQHEATTRLTKTDKICLEALTVLKTKLDYLEQKIDVEVTAVKKFLDNIECVQLKIKQGLANMAAIKVQVYESLNKIQQERKEFEIEKAKTQKKITQNMASMAAMKAESEENLKMIQEERKEFEIEKAKTQKKIKHDMASMAAMKAESEENLKKIQEERKEFEIEKAKSQKKIKQDMITMAAKKAEFEETLKKIQEERKELENLKKVETKNKAAQTDKEKEEASNQANEPCLTII